jgi:hypothetical protein
MRRAIDAVTFRKVPVVAIPRAGQATAPVSFPARLQAASKPPLHIGSNEQRVARTLAARGQGKT